MASVVVTAAVVVAKTFPPEEGLISEPVTSVEDVGTSSESVRT